MTFTELFLLALTATFPMVETADLSDSDIPMQDGRNGTMGTSPTTVLMDHDPSLNNSNNTESEPFFPPANDGAQTGNASTTNTSVLSGVSAPSTPICDNMENTSHAETNGRCREESSSPNPPKESSSPSIFDYMGYISVPILLVAGLTGNSLTVVVMLSRYFRHMSVSLLLIALAFSDTTLILLLPFTKLYVVQLIGTDIRTATLAGCKAFYFVWRCAKMTSSWFVVLICFERFVAVWFPLKTHLICNKRNTAIAIFCVYLFMFAYNGNWTRYSALVDGKCEPYYVTPETREISQALLVTGVTVYSVIPTALLLIITPSICYKLWRVSRNRKTMSRSSANGQKAATNTGRTTVMLIGVSLAFVILVAPVSIGHIVSSLSEESFFYSKDLGMTVLREISQMMEQANYSINFFLYVICSKSFRKRILEFLGCLKANQSKPGVQRQSTSHGGSGKAKGNFKNSLEEKSADTTESSCSNPAAS